MHIVGASKLRKHMFHDLLAQVSLGLQVHEAFDFPVVAPLLWKSIDKPEIVQADDGVRVLGRARHVGFQSSLKACCREPPQLDQRDAESLVNDVSIRSQAMNRDAP